MGKTFTIDENRLYKLFKRILDDKFSELTLDQHPDWKTSEDEIEWIDSDGSPVIYYHDETFHVLRKYYWSFLHYIPISYKQTNDLFSRYFEETFPDKPFNTVVEFDL